MTGSSGGGIPTEAHRRGVRDSVARRPWDQRLRWENTPQLAAHVFLDKWNPYSVKYDIELYTVIVERNGEYAAMPAMADGQNSADGFMRRHVDAAASVPARRLRAMIVSNTWSAKLARILRGAGVPIGCIAAISAAACDELPSNSLSERVDSGAPASPGSSVRKRALRQVPSLVRLMHWDDARWLLMNGVGVFFGACEGSGGVGPSIVEPDDALEYNNSYVTVTGTFQADLVYGLGDRLCSVTTIQASFDAAPSGR